MKKRKLLKYLPFMLVAASPVSAHSPVPGIEGFYVGLIHPFSTPPQALLLLGLGFLVGGFKPEQARLLLLCFLVASFTGLFFAFGFAEIDTIMFAIAFAACSMAALSPGNLVLLATALVGIGSFLIGDASVPDDGPIRDRLITMSGSMVGANVGLLYLCGICLLAKERYTTPWVGISFRVAAAWLGAVSLLMLALRFSTNDLPTL